MKDIFFALIRSAILGDFPVAASARGNRQALTEDDLKRLTSDDLQQLYALAEKHDLAHLVGHALFRGGLIDQASSWYQPFQKAQLKAVYRYEQSRHELMKIEEILEEAQIAYMPLKGAVVRDYYPEPWLRTSCDLDVLVQEEDLDRAVEALCRAGWSAKAKKAYHDISLYSAGGVHLELHFNIKENKDVLDRVLEAVWAHSAPESGQAYRYRQSNEFLLFHLLAHMSYHFTDGGCGVRSFLDIWLLRRALTWDDAALRRLCAEAQILKFYEAVLALTDVWFGGSAHTELTRQLEAFVTSGGVYGSTANRVMVNQAQTGGRLQNLRDRIFMPFGKLKTMYPVLQRHGWLCPVFEVVRWAQILASGRGRHAVHELKLNQSSSKEQVQEAGALLEKLGLK